MLYYNKETAEFLYKTKFYLDQIFRYLYRELIGRRQSYFRNASDHINISATKSL